MNLDPAHIDPTRSRGSARGGTPIVIDPTERRQLLHIAFAVVLAATAAGVALYAVWRGVPLASGLCVAILAPAVVVDVVQRRIPDRYVGLAIAGGACAQFGAWMADGGVTANADVVRMGVGAILMGGPLLAVHLVAPSAMGFGDVKAAFVLGAAVGLVDWRLGLTTLAVGAGVTAVVGLVRNAPTVPLGPGLVGAAALSLLAPGLLVPGAA